MGIFRKGVNEMKIKTILLVSFLLLSGVASAQPFDIVRPNEDYQDCVGISVQYCRENPEYTPCSISRFPTFKMSHMVAVKIVDDETIEVHDGMNNAHFTVHNWIVDGDVMWDDWGTYFHFWLDEPVKRNFYRLWDNRDVVLNA